MNDNRAQRNSNRTKRRAGIVGLSLLAMIPLGLGLGPAVQHYRAVSHWPTIGGTVIGREVLDRPSVGYRRSSAVSQSIRDTYRINRNGSEQICYWDDPFATAIKSWTDARMTTRQRYWPIGASVNLHADRDSDRCEPDQGWERTGFVTSLLLVLASITLLGAATWILIAKPGSDD
jgi:hypothetical protein